jgi:DNA-binding transcriptional MerR regulator
MTATARFFGPSDAAKQLGVSSKALRLYEQQGLLKPIRTPSGWRTYGPAEMARAAEIVSLRALGLSIALVGRVLRGDSEGLESALGTHQSALEGRIHQLADTVKRIRALRADLAQGKAPSVRELARLAQPVAEVSVAFDLPWPWGGERFELRQIHPLNYIIGPLFSGKTRLARAIAQHLPDTIFVGLDRLENGGAEAAERIDADYALKSRVERALGWLVEDGATVSPALISIVVALDAAERNVVIDMVEQGLDQETQEALIAYMRHRSSKTRAVFLLTRSSAILDLTTVGSDEAIILCPANHSPPTRVAPYPGAPGYEAVATCLASPEVRARTAGVVAIRRP